MRAQTKRRLMAAVVSALALTVGAPAAAQAGPTFHGTDAEGNLLTIERVGHASSSKHKRVKKATRGWHHWRHRGAYAVTRKTPLEFTPAGATRLVGIDERPISGELYGVGDNSVVYRVNPRTGVATGVAGPLTAPFGNTLRGSLFGVDFNPTSPGGGAIRIVSDANYNHRVGPDTGANGAMTPDGDLQGGMGTTRIVHAAYTNSGLSTTQPTTTQLYVLDAAGDRLYVQNPPNAGTLTNPVRVRFDVTDAGGFDVAGADEAYVAAEHHGGTKLYALDLASGRSESFGMVWGAKTLTGLAVAQER